MKPIKRILAISVLLFFVAVSHSRATQVLHRSPKQLGQQASLVVRGKVSGVRSFWNDKHTKIFTETTIAIEQTYKGTPPQALRILQLGGVVDNVRVNVAGALQWRAQEEVLVFLEPYVRGSYQVSGFSQGKFGIVRDPQTRQPYVERPASEGIELVGSATPEALRRASRIDKVPLEQFINQTLVKQEDRN